LKRHTASSCVAGACCILFVKLINYSNNAPPPAPPNLQLFYSGEFSPLGDQQNQVRTRRNDCREKNDFKDQTISEIAIFRQQVSAGFFFFLTSLSDV
jgi:hypothetical protein